MNSTYAHTHNQVFLIMVFKIPEVQTQIIIKFDTAIAKILKNENPLTPTNFEP